MSQKLRISVGQFSDKGRKPVNQDFHGAYVPHEPQLTGKGAAIALADGISSSGVSQVASEAAVSGFLEDYYCTSDAWSVKKSAQCVLTATNSWLYAQTQQSQYRYDKDLGYVCTFSALILKSTTAHVFHVGDSRVFRLRGNSVEQLTNDHRVWVTREQSYLGRALGVNQHLEIDYQQFAIESDDVFILATDGTYEFASADFIASAIVHHADDLNQAAHAIVQEAYQQGSDDNITVQIVRVDNVPALEAANVHQRLNELAFAPVLEARAQFDGYLIVRELHASSRSHVYLARDSDSGETVAIKTPSTDMQGDPAFLERFMMEEWVARRINSPHVVKACPPARKRDYVYIVTEYIEGQTLTQWLIDNPRPDVETVRGIVEQIAKGLQAFHRLEMLHQDLRPANIMIDSSGTVKIIDLGSTRVAGIVEIASPFDQHDMLGTVQYTAPEYFLGENGTYRSDIFSLGVITYQMLSGHLPYGTQVSKSRTKAAQNRLKYRSLLDDDRDIPVWLDAVIKKAVHPNPYKRYGELSEFVYDLRHPNRAFLSDTHQPLMERNPLLFWKTLSFVLAVACVVLLVMLLY